MESNNYSPYKIEGPRAERKISFRAFLNCVAVSALIIIGLVSYSISVISDNHRLSDRLANSSYYIEKAAEKTLLTRYDALVSSQTDDTYNIMIRLSNEASIQTTYRYFLLYCISSECTIQDPLVNPTSIESIPFSLEPGNQKSIEVGPVTNDLIYRIDVITDNGNIISSGECKADLIARTCQGPSLEGEFG